MKITTDEQYFECLERLVKGVEYLDNPLIRMEDYNKAMKLYDKLTEEILRYKGLVE